MSKAYKKTLFTILIITIILYIVISAYHIMVYYGTIRSIDSDFSMNIGNAAIGFDGTQGKSIAALNHMNRAVSLARHTSYEMHEVSDISLIASIMETQIVQNGQLPEDKSIGKLFKELSKDPTNLEITSEIIKKLRS